MHRLGALSEDARRLNALVTGHRYLRGAVQVGGSALALDAARVDDARERLAALAGETRRAWRALLFSQSLQDRLDLIGIVTPADARRLGAAGPAATRDRDRGGRAHGRARPRLRRLRAGDRGAAARRRDRARRPARRRAAGRRSRCSTTSSRTAPLEPAEATRGSARAGTGVARVESPRGATICVVEPDGERVGRVRLRTGSYATWPTVAHSAAGNLLPDFPLINKSFELCYACADR